MKSKICKICESKIKNDKEMIKPNSKLGNVHIECYRNRLLESYVEKIVDEKINHFIRQRDIVIEEKLKKEKDRNDIKLKNEKNKINLKENKDKFYNYIKLHYDCNLNTYFFTKVSNIVNGTYKGLKEGIPYEDLLYMFQTKQKELDRIAFDKERKGNGFKDTNSRLNFDLAVIVNKYDSYKKWKEKQKLLEVKHEDIKKTTDELINISVSRKKNLNNNDNDDISDLLDEVF